MTQIHDRITFPCFLNPKKQKSIRSYWAWAQKQPRCKSRLVKTDEWIRTPPLSVPVAGITDGNLKTSRKSYYAGYYSEGTGVYRKPGWLQAEHHILYNIIRGVPIERGFTPGKKGKRWHENSDGFEQALFSLIYKIEVAQRGWTSINKGNLGNMTFTHLKITREFIEPFADSVALSDLISIDVKVLRNYLKERRNDKD